ncbi:Imm1 family immunity protein [Actinomadura sp. HBU206391]|uniref:Imm1 family immunity protein n=1 Tax=Actinomadura sp. HBU206391 TaxID=2731692 RepID=UPI00164F70D1|nr:Imm1 family immunity protein [Actinomadura sp. HBU206391]MBC6459397.1 hypothetical protein [Actinomadura sp. HBU206391]
MTYLMINHLVYPEKLSGPKEAAEKFDEAVREILRTGRSGQALWFRPQGEGEGGDLFPRDFVHSYDGNGEGLRIEIDIEVDRAAVTWLPDHTIAVELPPGDPLLHIVWSIDARSITVAGYRARVSATSARRAVIEYITTGERPTTGLTWQPA